MARGHQILSEEILDDIKGGLPKAPTKSPSSLTTAEEAAPLLEESFHGSLEDAANLLLSILPPSVRDYATELADITLKLPRWQLILGSVMAQQESGSLPSPSIDPAWKQIELILEKSICDYCKKEFTPKRFKQKYCSNTCGDKARGEEIAKRNKLREEIKIKEAGLGL